MAWYNFCRVHQTLRVTPAMEAGIADHVWSIRDLLTVTVDAQKPRKAVASSARVSIHSLGMVAQPSALDDGSESTVEGDDLILRDVLAIDRTILANERTVLAYFRTMLALLAAGGSLIHFIEAWWVLPVGVTLLISAPLLFGFGVWRYRRVSRDLRRRRR